MPHERPKKNRRVLAAGLGLTMMVVTLLTGPVASAATSDVLLPWGSNWRWHNAVEDPAGGDWRGRFYRDAGWSAGRAPLGWNRPGIRTDISTSGTQSRSVQFRSTFTVADPLEGPYAVDLIADDGAVVFVNGVEIGRVNVPGGPFLRDVNAYDTTLRNVTLEIPDEVVRWGTNTIAVSTHLNYRGSQRVSFDAQVRQTDELEDVSRLISAGSWWRYALVTSEPGDSWAGSTTVTAPWALGAAPVGTSGSHLRTLAATGENRDVQLLLQRTFSLPDLAGTESVTIRAVADDGVQLFVNGTEVGRANLGSGALAFRTRASSTYGGVAEIEAPLSVLRQGTNVIAAQVRPNYRASLSLGFDAEVLVAPGEASASPSPSASPTASPTASPSPSPSASPTAAAVPPPPEANLPGWGAPVWHDEFTGSMLDTSRWRTRTGTYLSYDEAIIGGSQVSVANGSLRIVTERLEDPVTRGGRLRAFDTGYVDTIGRFSQQYGRWEMRARLPLTEGASRGLWPAFWLRDSAGLGEIDIMEAIGDPHTQLRAQPAGSWSSTIHESTSPRTTP